MVGIEEREAKALLNLYFSAFPRIKIWHMNVESQLRREAMMITPLGRKRVFFGRFGDQLFRDGYSFIPQSTVADILNIALVRTWNAFKEIDAQLVLQVHDSFVIQCKDVPAVKDILKNAFNVPITINRRTFVIPYDVKIGSDWNNLKHDS